MIYVCHICSAETGSLVTDICPDCDIALKAVLPAPMRYEVNQELHDLDEHEGRVV